MLLLHAGMVVFPFISWMLAGSSAWWMLFTPLCFWGGVALLVVLYFATRGVGLMAHLVLLPGGRFLTMPLVVHNSLVVINACLESGMMLARALRLAAGACGNQVMGRRLEATADRFEGERVPTLTEALEDLGYPPTTVAIVRAGETGGNLDEALTQAQDVARESFRSRVTWTTRTILGIIFVGILLTIAASIIFAFMKIYMGPLQDAMKLSPG